MKENAKIGPSKSTYEFNKYKYTPHSPIGTKFKPERMHTDPIDPKKTTVFSPEFILSFKPQNIEIPKEYQLKSPGYVILKQFEESVDSNTEPIRKPRALRVHEGRFIPSIMRKKYVEGDEEEERKVAVQTCLNRLNFKNSADIIKSLKELKASNDLIVNLLLDRAAVDEDLPEKNSHLRNFANFAIQIANEDNDFKLICQTKSLDKYNELINKKSNELNINVIECLIVWISYLVMGRVIKRKQYFQCFERAITRQQKNELAPDTAFGIIRASFFTCGKFLDDQNWSESATFYRYMFVQRPKTGYLLFLREDLQSLRNSGWNEQFFNQNQNENQPISESNKINTNSPQKLSFDKNDEKLLQKILRDKLLEDYNSWHEDLEFGTPRVPRQAKLKEVVNAVILNFANEQKKIQPEIEDYSKWFGLLIANAEIDNKELPKFLKDAMKQSKDKNSPEYGDFMIGFFTILGGLYDVEQIKFSSIVNLGVLTKLEYIDAVGRTAYIDQKEIYDILYPPNDNSNDIHTVTTFTPVALSAISSAPNFLRSVPSSFEKEKYDDSIIAALATITYRSENVDRATDYEKAVDFAGIVYNCLEENEEATEPNIVFDPRKNEIIEAAKKMRENIVTEVWNKIILTSQIAPDFIDKSKYYFYENILINKNRK